MSAREYCFVLYLMINYTHSPNSEHSSFKYSIFVYSHSIGSI